MEQADRDDLALGRNAGRGRVRAGDDAGDNGAVPVAVDLAAAAVDGVDADRVVDDPVAVVVDLVAGNLLADPGAAGERRDLEPNAGVDDGDDCTLATDSFPQR